jgi:ribonuclease J
MLAGPDELWFLPLGGTGEIGMNLNLYAHDGAWLMVDLGVIFAEERQPGVELIMPDPSFIEGHRDKLAGLVLTHAHEDHIGAVPYLWPRLRCPVYATPFTAAVLRGKLRDNGFGAEIEITEVPMSGRFTVGPFELELITLTHSIPEPNAVAIRTPAGTVLHTGDWKLDPDPLVGDDYDESALRRLAGEGVLAMVCDSTNALVEGESGSEGAVRHSLAELIGGLTGRVVVACFATNVARLESAIRVAEAHGRRVALVGRSMHRIHQAALETGYLADLPPLLTDREIGFLPREEVLLLCTGSQGEPRAALWRITRDEHPEVMLEPGDAVVFSSRMIPGNEKAILALQNELVRRGIEVITDQDHFTHVSGHPARDELAQMYQWVRPQLAVPVHGEARVDQLPVGRLMLDGTRLIRAESPVLRERQRVIYNGVALVTLVVDAKGALRAEPRLALEGVLDADSEVEVAAEVLDALSQELAKLPAAARTRDERLAETARVTVRRALFQRVGKKPVTRVHLVRL